MHIKRFLATTVAALLLQGATALRADAYEDWDMTGCPGLATHMIVDYYVGEGPWILKIWANTGAPNYINYSFTGSQGVCTNPGGCFGGLLVYRQQGDATLTAAEIGGMGDVYFYNVECQQ